MNTDPAALDLIIFAGSVVFGLACWYFDFSYRLSIVAGLVLLAVGALLVAIGVREAASTVGLLVYWLFVVGIVLALVELRGQKGHQEGTTFPAVPEEPEGHSTFTFDRFFRAEHLKKPRRP